VKWRFPWSREAAVIDKAAAAGPGGFTPTVTVPPPTKPAGADGTAIIGGFVVSGERDPKLTSLNKWVTYDNATLNVAIIGSAINVWTQLAGSATWSVEPNKRGGADAQRAADLVQEGLLDAQLSVPWRQIVRRQIMKKFRGFAMHEIVLRRRSDDMIVVGDIQDRPQWTIYRWNRPDPQAEWEGVEQLTQQGYSSTYYIPRERLFYSVENTLSPNPEGVGLLRQMAESVRVLEIYQRLEGVGFQTELGGVPIARAPLSKIAQDLGTQGKSDLEIQVAVREKVSMLEAFLRSHNRNPESGLMLDSATYTNRDASLTPSSIYEWAFDLIKSSGGDMGSIGTAIGRVTRDIARVMCAEWLLLGGEDSGGAYSMHADKTAMFGLVVNSALNDVADDARRDIATRLVALNGLDPELCTPRLVAAPVATGAVKDACAALAALFQAGLNPTDPAINVLRSRMDLPPAPSIDETDLLLPRGTEIERLGADGRIEAVEAATGQPVGPGAAPTDAAPGKPGNANARSVGKYAPDQSRDEHGQWSSGGGGGGGGAWTRAFDSRDHMREIEIHRSTESEHRAAASDLKSKIGELRSQSKDATPGRAAQIDRRIGRLQAQHDEHVGIAHDAASARRATQADLAGRRASHAQGLRDQADARREADAHQVQDERDAIGRVGGMRIGGEGDHGAEGESSSPVPHYSDTPDHHMGIGTGERIAGEPVVAPVVPQRGLTSEDWAERGRASHAEWAAAQDHQRLQAETAARQTARANDEYKQREQGARDLPVASARPSLGQRLRGMLGSKKASATAVDLLELEAMLDEHEEPTK